MPFYEIFCGVSSSLVISPIMTIIDTAVIKTQATKSTLKQAIQESVTDYMSKKMSFKKPFSVMFFVYASTYSTANLTEYGCKEYGLDYRLPTFLATSLVNVTTISYKDKVYAKLFEQKPKYFPKLSYGLFALRDSMTIGSSFILKKNLTHYLDPYMPHNTADFISSLVLPMTAQLFSTPIHILAIDYYQRPHVKAKERIHLIKTLYASICSGRVLRVIPAFCAGGFLNDMLRDRKHADF